MNVQGETLGAGDAAAIDDAGPIDITGTTNGEVLLFDLAEPDRDPLPRAAGHSEPG